MHGSFVGEMGEADRRWSTLTLYCTAKSQGCSRLGMEVQNTCLHDTGVPSPPLTVSIHTGHHPAPNTRENAWLVLATSCIFCFPKPLSQIKWTEKSSILSAGALWGCALQSLCYPATHPGEDGAYADGEVSLLAQLHQPLNKRQRESSSAAFCQHSNVKCKVWSCHTPSWYSHGSRTL